jgi:signal peptidase II
MFVVPRRHRAISYTLPLVIGCAAAVVLIDQLSKHWVIEGMNLRQVGEMTVAPFVKFRMAWNTGVNFGLLANDGSLSRTVLIAGQSVLALALMIGALWARRTIHIAGLGVAAGGAIGNILDRWTWGAVADFLNVSCCGIDNPWSFNVADIAVFGGLALLLWPAGRPDGDQSA